MIVAGFYETMHKISKTLKTIKMKNHLKSSLNMNSFIEKINLKTPTTKCMVQKSQESPLYSHQYTIANFNFKQEHMYFLKVFTFILITVNSIVLCIDSVTFSMKTRKILRMIDFILLMFFYCEIIIKLIFQKEFIKKFLNLLDLAIFLLNISAQIYLASLHCDFLEEFDCSANLYDLIRVFQVLRILRILISSLWANISILILEFMKILRKMHTFLIILMTFLCLFSLIGRDLFRFSNISQEIQQEELLRLNFNGFLNAFFTNFLIFIDEEWHLIMFAHMKTFSNIAAIIYFVINLLFCTIFLNKVFLAALINNLIESKNIRKLIVGKSIGISKFKEFLAKIKKFLHSDFIKKRVKSKKKFATTYKNNPFHSKSLEKSKIFNFHQKSIESSLGSKNNTQNDHINKSWKHKIIQIRKHPYFLNFMIISVFYILITLALNDPYQSPNSRYNLILTYLDIPVFFVFTMELLFELIPHENGYFSISLLMKLTNCLLFLCYFILEVKFLKLVIIFRLFLEVNFSKELKLAFKALMKSILDILQLSILFLLISVLFALIGVKCLQGAFWYCDGVAEEFMQNVINQENCMDFGGDWVNSDFNFVNIFKAFEMMFIVANTEGWLPLM